MSSTSRESKQPAASAEKTAASGDSENPHSSLDSRDPLVSFSQVGRFIRQLSHDVRNGLNAIDLEGALIAELSSEAEVTGEAKKIRGIVANVTRSLQQLSSRFVEVQLDNAMECGASEFAEAAGDRIATNFSEQGKDSLSWRIDAQSLAEKNIEADVELLLRAFSEIAGNAFQFREENAPVEIRVAAAENQFVFEVREKTKSADSQAAAAAPETWGREPFFSTRRGGYGLGLFHARRIIEAHGGALESVFDEASKTVTVTARLPLKSFVAQ